MAAREHKYTGRSVEYAMAKTALERGWIFQDWLASEAA
jgi:hypothetical protein